MLTCMSKLSTIVPVSILTTCRQWLDDSSRTQRLDCLQAKIKPVQSLKTNIRRGDVKAADGKQINVLTKDYLAYCYIMLHQMMGLSDRQEH